jgi:hypothetical protein
MVTLALLASILEALLAPTFFFFLLLIVFDGNIHILQ